MPYSAVIDFFRRHSPGRVALASHMRPDGDAIGSCLGLAYGLCAAGIEAKVVNPGPLPHNLAFLADGEMIVVDESPEWWRGYDCFGVLDCGEAERLEEINRGALALPTFNIDHHASGVGVGETVWNEPEASSVGEMVVRLCLGAGWPLTSSGAQALWVAIITDTGRFCFENASVSALTAARDCVAAGANPGEAAKWLYQSVTLSERRLEALVLSRMELFEGGRMAASWLDGKDFVSVGMGIEGAQDRINLLRDTAGVEVALFLYQIGDGDKVKASLRTSSPYDALDVVKLYGGGGHRRAAGCTVALSMERAREEVVAAVRRAYFSVSASDARSAL